LFERTRSVANDKAVEERAMDGSEIDMVRALLSSKPRPVGWVQRRERLDEVGSIWPVADDVNLESVDLDGVPAEIGTEIWLQFSSA